MEINQKQIDAAFKAANGNDAITSVLVAIFGAQKKSRFESYKDIKSYEDACEYLNIEPLPDDCSCTFDSSVDYKPTADEVAYAKLKVIARALRGGEEFSYKKAIENGKYYYPWWYVCTKEYYEKNLSKEEKKRAFLFGGLAGNGANAGFACGSAGDAPSNAYANIGSRLCFYDRERCEYFCEQFKELIAQYNFIGCE